MKNALLLLFCFLFLVSCEKKEAITPDTGTPYSNMRGAFYEYLIAPSTTDPSILLFNNRHYVCLDTRTTQKNKLFVFFPGTGGSPEFYKLVVKRAASLGYHAIGLMYPNSSDMYSWSGLNSDNTQFGKCRNEIFTGINQTAGVTVDTTNSINNRLSKLLQYLAVQYPTLNFQQYISGKNVNWSKCVLAGHSQGGGHAFYIAKQVTVDRAIAFASIDWNGLLNISADWVSSPGATPISKFYSINSTRDEVFSYANVQVQLANMGLLGNAVSIDNTPYPYGSSRKLITSATPALALLVPNHNVTCLDAYVPKTSSGTVKTTFNNAWQYLISY